MKTVRLVAWAAIMLLLAWGGMRFFSQSENQVSGPGGPFTLTAHTGEKVSDSDFRGKYMLIYFGYSYCPDVCRIELHKLTVALELLEGEGYDTSLIQPLFITIDPERDTAAELADYVPDFHASLIGLTGSLADIADIAAKYKVYYRKRVQEGIDGYLMDHQSYVFVMNPDGSYNRLFTARDTPQDIADTFKPVLTKK